MGTSDPLQQKYLDISPYAYCNNYPTILIDPDGLSPIYSIYGILLGTDNEGLQGPAIIMETAIFKQKEKGLTHEEAMKYNLGEKGLVRFVYKRFANSYYNLDKRPDWDGYITLDEANEWYRTGKGEPLFADLSKIDLSGLFSLGERFVDQTRPINLFLVSLINPKDALVYGSIKLKRYPNHYVRAYADTYDFDIQISRPIRNISTIIGKMVAGKGTEYTIHLYGSQQLKPLLPWMK